ncbi:unnamed protein product, partial [Prorocentrum cordatum]
MAAAAFDGLVQDTAVGRPTSSGALDWISQNITAEHIQMQKRNTAQWRQRFASGSNEAWKAATPLFKGGQPAPAHAAAYMHEQWAKHWKPENYDNTGYVAAWRQHFPKSTRPQDWMPSLDIFAAAARQAKHCPVLDGWTSHELQALEKIYPAVIEELYELRASADMGAAYRDAATKTLRKVIVQSSVENELKLVCFGRYWAHNILLHPEHSAAILGFQNLIDERLVWGDFLGTALSEYARALGRSLVRYSPTPGAVLQVDSHGGFRIRDAVEQLAGDDWRFTPNRKAAQRALRGIARIRCLQLVVRTRFDAE